MQITCIDQSNGNLFFAHDFLSELILPENDVILYLPEDSQKIYGSFFDHFPQIKTDIKIEFEIKQNIIFSDFDNLPNVTHYNKALIYPIIDRDDFVKFKKFVDNQDSNLENMINPVITGINASVALPLSHWAIDMLHRNLGNQLLKNISLLISAGPTIEDIDPVRYLTNRSSGKMGIALARAAYRLGADVKLILGPSTVEPPNYLPIIKVRSASDMYDAVISYFDQCHVYIGSAAIADFTPSNIKQNKIKKKDGFPELILKPTKDILNEIKTIKKNQFVIGFSVETTDTIENSKLKLINKNLDLIVVNNPKEKGAAFDADTNVVSIIFKDGRVESWPIMSKLDVAMKLMSVIQKFFDK